MMVTTDQGVDSNCFVCYVPIVRPKETLYWHGFWPPSNLVVPNMTQRLRKKGPCDLEGQCARFRAGLWAAQWWKSKRSDRDGA